MAKALFKLRTLHQGRWWLIIEKLDMGDTYPFHTHYGLQLWLSSVSSCGGHWLCHSIASMDQGHLHPPLTIHSPVDLHFHYMIPKAFTLLLWMLWWTSFGKVITSHWSTPGQSVWAGTRCLPDHYLLVAWSLPHYIWELAQLGWGWYICPMLGGCPHTRECQSLAWWEVGFGGGCMTVCIGLSLHRRGHLLQSDTPPHMPHLLFYP